MFQEKELTQTGTYYVPSIYGIPAGEVPRYNTPITPKENMILMLEKGEPLWLPNQNLDNNIIQPDIMPDAHARNHGGIDWFGIDWQFEPLTEAAMVRPGTRRLSDIVNWKKEIIWPDLQDLDWKKDYEDNYKGKMSSDRFTVFVVFNGLFERLADLTSFEDAFCYLLEEPEVLAEFFEKLTDWHIELFQIAKDVYHTDMLLFHDDMGSQRSPFFSSAMYESILLPHYQRITKAAHQMGMYITLHSCGNVESHLPSFIKAGFDAWEGQDNANNKEVLMENYGKDLAQLSMFELDQNLSDEDALSRIHQKVEHLGAKGRWACRLFDYKENRLLSSAQELYRYSRIFYGR